MASSARIEELEKKFNENPRRYFAPLANEYRKAGDLTQAISICRTYVPQQPGHMSGHIVFGQALFEAGELDEARGVFESALQLDPENLIALRHLGDIARARGDIGAARAWYRRVLDADPRNDEIVAQIATLDGMADAPAVPSAPVTGIDAAMSDAMSGWHEINPERTLELPATLAESAQRITEGTSAWLETPGHDEPLIDAGAESVGAEIDGFYGEGYTGSMGEVAAEAPVAAEPPAPEVPPADQGLGLEVMEFVPPTRRQRDVEPAAVADSADTPAAFVTETMAELYLQQGFRDEALEVYRQLLVQSPDDDTLRERVAQLESGSRSSFSAAGGVSDSVIEAANQRRNAPTVRSVRAFFGDLAARRVVTRYADRFAPPSEHETQDEADERDPAPARDYDYHFDEPTSLSESPVAAESSAAVDVVESETQESVERESVERESVERESVESTLTSVETTVTVTADAPAPPAVPEASAPVAPSPFAPTPFAATPFTATPFATPFAATPFAAAPVGAEPTPAVPVAAAPVVATPAFDTPFTPAPAHAEPMERPPVAAEPTAAEPLRTPRPPELPTGGFGIRSGLYDGRSYAEESFGTPDLGGGAFGESALAEPEYGGESLISRRRDDVDEFGLPASGDAESFAFEQDAPAPPPSSSTGSVNGLFPDAHVAPSDQAAAETLSSAFASLAAPEASEPPQSPGVRRASTELSLDSVFRETPPPPSNTAPRREPGAFSFDQFFGYDPFANGDTTPSKDSAPEPSSSSAEPPRPATGAPSTEPAETEQFSSWLSGLKKK
jgi:tetratricopeptide (TPR) repeat protein